ncbi:hypothetical protein AHAS_Ahas09G0136400 [Arachis hypogaea]
MDRQAKRMELRNKRQFTYLKELIVGNHPPEEDHRTLRTPPYLPTSGAVTVPIVEMMLSAPLCS